VSVQALPEGQFALQMHKVWYKWKFPDHVMSQEQLPASDLELQLVKASRDVIRLVESQLGTTIRDMQLLFMQDLHSNLKLAGTQQTYLSENSLSPDRLFRLMTPASRLNTRSHSTAIRLQKRTSESPARPISTLIRPKLRAKPRKLPKIEKISPLAGQLLVAPRRIKHVEIDNSPAEPVKPLLMIDQEAQAQTWESVDSAEANRLRVNTSSMMWAQYKGIGAHLQTVNSTISLPEAEHLPRAGVLRLGDLKQNPRRLRAKSTLRKESPV